MQVLRRTSLGRTLAAAAFALAFGLVSLPGASQAATLDTGTRINAVLATEDINTKNAQIGDAFSMNVVPPYPNRNLAGAVLRGHVAGVTAAGQGRKAQIRLAFDSIVFSNGTSRSISGTVTKMSTKSENTTARKGIGAAVGAAVGSQTIGRIIGGSAGGVIGILGGAAGGYMYANNAKANFNLAKGASVEMTTSRNVEVPRRQAGQ